MAKDADLSDIDNPGVTTLEYLRAALPYEPSMDLVFDTNDEPEPYLTWMLAYVEDGQRVALVRHAEQAPEYTEVQPAEGGPTPSEGGSL